MRDHAGVAIDDRDSRAREVDEELLARPVLLAHDDVEPLGIDPISLGKPGVAKAVGAALPIFGPEQHERDVRSAELPVDRLPIRHRPVRYRRRRCRSAEEPFLELAVVGIGRQRPAKTGLGRSNEVVADGRPWHGQGDRDVASAQMLGPTEPQHLSDLAHGGTGTGQRLFSSLMAFIKDSVADATSLT